MLFALTYKFIFQITDMMQKSLFDYLKTRFEGRCNIVRISSDLSLARRNMVRNEETRQGWFLSLEYKLKIYVAIFYFSYIISSN